jgi:hypothetical protein
MDREDIIRMAREAGLAYGSDEKPLNSVTRFAALVAAAEREACAAICDRFQARDVGMQPAECAGAIRARGNA